MVFAGAGRSTSNDSTLSAFAQKKQFAKNSFAVNDQVQRRSTFVSLTVAFYFARLGEMASASLRRRLEALECPFLKNIDFEG